MLDQIHVCRVVLDIEQGALRRTSGQLRPDRGLNFAVFDFKLGCRRQDQFAPEHASHPDRAFHAENALHQFGQSFCHHQTDARAGHTAGPLAQPVERLEQLRQFFRRQSRAGIRDADANAFRACRTGVRQRRGAHGAIHDHRSLLFVVFDRIGNEIDDDLFQARPICPDKDGAVESGKGHADAVLLRLRLHHGLAFGHDLGH